MKPIPFTTAVTTAVEQIPECVGRTPHGRDDDNVVGFVLEVDQVLDHQTRVSGAVFSPSPNSQPNDDSVRLRFGERWKCGCVGAVALTHRMRCHGGSQHRPSGS